MKEERPLSVRARKKVKAELERKEREKLMNLFQRRMELARSGSHAFKSGRMKAAVQDYFRYLDILEKTKGVKSGGLRPNLFDAKKDIAELLLLSGVYWDLAKLHDKVSKKDTTKLTEYIQQFVSFSKGQPFQHVSAELIRKFLINGTPRHRGLFKDAHIALGGGKCFIATAVEDYCAEDTLTNLRVFRDQYLLTRVWGRVFVKTYYTVGPYLARAVLRLPENAQKKIARSIDQIALKVSRN